jgi:hypothetical protein
MDHLPADPTMPRVRRPINRRHLLAIGGLAVLGLTPFAFRSTYSHARRILEKEFGPEIVLGEAADRFVADVSRLLEERGGLRRRLARLGSVYFREVPLFGVVQREMEDTVITLFLTRTNAYRVHLKQDDELVYVSLDPYSVGCTNFLSAQFKPS